MRDNYFRGKDWLNFQMKFEGEEGIKSDAILDFSGADHVPDFIDGDEFGFEFFMVIPGCLMSFGAIFDEYEEAAIG